MLTGLIFAGVVALAQPPQTAEQNGEPTESERQLGEIVTTGPEFNLGPQTGKFIFTPVLMPRGGGGSPLAIAVDFYFTPVVEVEDDTAILYSGQQRSRYRMRVNIPASGATGTRINARVTKPRTLGEQSINLPAGTYVLSEIRYTVLDLRQGTGFQTVRGESLLNASTGRSAKSFCLSEETYAFDIENGKDQHLGLLALTAIPSNLGRLSQFHPVTGIDQSLEYINARSEQTRTDIEVVEWDLLSFSSSGDICKSQPRFDVAALAPNINDRNTARKR